MPDESMSQAIREAMASVPTDSVILHTIELSHPSFVEPIRVVQDNVDHTLTLEDSAPVNPGEAVLFKSYPFQMTQPSITDNSTPESTITIDNVSREIVNAMERAVESNEVIRVTYRPYLSNDKTTPQYDSPLHLTLTDVVATTMTVSGRVRFRDLANKQFPREKYTAKRFPRLVD